MTAPWSWFVTLKTYAKVRSIYWKIAHGNQGSVVVGPACDRGPRGFQHRLSHRHRFGMESDVQHIAAWGAAENIDGLNWWRQAQDSTIALSVTSENRHDRGAYPWPCLSLLITCFRNDNSTLPTTGASSLISLTHLGIKSHHLEKAASTEFIIVNEWSGKQ